MIMRNDSHSTSSRPHQMKSLTLAALMGGMLSLLVAATTLTSMGFAGCL